MSTKRNSCSPEQKSKIVLEVIRGDQTIAQITSKYRVHSTPIIRWKKQLLASAPAVFSDARWKKEQDAKDILRYPGGWKKAQNLLRYKPFSCSKNPVLLTIYRFER